MGGPRIIKIEWVEASQVLPHEERDFSRWLAENLDLLADALDLGELVLVEAESRVGTYRADLVCVADDGSDEGLPVVIENQYGSTNHDHLGKVITYLAQQQRGLGVWVAERFSDAHLAAVEFLNRTSDDSVGYALVTVRFAPAPEGHYVDFPVVARPNLYLKEAQAGTGTRRETPERRQFLENVHALVAEPLRQHGWEARLASNRRVIRLIPPTSHALFRHGYFSLRASPTTFAFRHIVTGMGTFEESEAVVVALAERYRGRLEERAPAGTTFLWGTGKDRRNRVNDAWHAEHPDGGYRDLEPADAAEWAVQLTGTWSRLIEDEPPIGLIDAARDEYDGEAGV